jgi:hypothetical protein
VWLQVRGLQILEAVVVVLLALAGLRGQVALAVLVL